MKRKMVLFVTTFALMIFAGNLQATLVDVNMLSAGGRPTGAAGTGTAGDYWNNYAYNVTVPNVMSLQDTTDNASGISMYVNQVGGYSVYVSGMQTLFYSYWGPNDGGYNDYVIFSGFETNELVDIYCYSGKSGLTGNGQEFKCVNVTADDLDGNETKRGTDVSNVTSFVEGANYVVFYGVVPDVNGEIKIYSDYSWMPTNGYQLDITSVPEPATIGLLGLGGLVALIRRKK